MTSAALMELTRQRKISETDHVRQGVNGPWMKAGELESLFPDHGAAPTAADAAADILSHPGRTRLQRQMESENEGGPLLGAVRQRFRAFFGGAVDAAGSVGDAVRSAAQKYPVTQVALGMGVLAVFVAIVVAVRMVLVSRPPGTEDAYAVCQSYLKEWRELRSREAAPEEWEELQARSGLAMFPLVQAMEKIAGSQNRVAQQLLWACRDTWPQMFEESREAVSAAELQFQERLNNVDRLLEGETVYARAEDRQVAQKPVPSPMKFLLAGPAETEWMNSAILGFDAVLIVGFIVWWRRRGRGNAVSSTEPV